MTPAGTSYQLNVQNKWGGKKKKTVFVFFFFAFGGLILLRLMKVVYSVCVCVYIFIKLHITAQSGPVILDIPLALILPRGDVCDTVCSSHSF